MLQSNVGKIVNMFRECLVPELVPKHKKDILDPFYENFFQHCIQPYEGRLKVWGADIRFSSFFSVLSKLQNYFRYMFFELESDIQREEKSNFLKIVKEFNESFRSLYETIFDLDPEITPRKWRNIYRKKIKHLFTLLKRFNYQFGQVIQDFEQESDIQQYLNWADSKDAGKSPVSKVKDLKKIFPFGVVSEWFDFIKKRKQYDASIAFLDMEILYRLYWLIKRRQSGIIVILAGSNHTTTINKMIKIANDYISLNPEETMIPMLKLKKGIKKSFTHSPKTASPEYSPDPDSEEPIPISLQNLSLLNCEGEETSYMKKYRKFLKKKSKK